VLEGLADGDHECVPVLIDREGVWREGGLDGRDGEAASGAPLELRPGGGLLGADVVFPALHGPFGEDGTVQGLLECLEVPYVGANVLASATCMDKWMFKRLMAEAGVPQVRYEGVYERDWRSSGDRVLARLRAVSVPCFVKPARQGSSYGITRVASEEELSGALDAAFEHDARVLVEAAAEGKEVECSVIGNDEPIASEPGQVVASAEWYDYESKYAEGGMELIVPAPIGESQRERVRRLALDAFTSSACSGLARVDFFVTPEGQVLVNELNTIPGFTSTSVFARLFEASGIGYVELLDRLLGYALERHTADRRHRF
jgi:D-alanine-D-alanine ligase